MEKEKALELLKKSTNLKREYLGYDSMFRISCYKITLMTEDNELITVLYGSGKNIGLFICSDLDEYGFFKNTSEMSTIGFLDYVDILEQSDKCELSKREIQLSELRDLEVYALLLKEIKEIKELLRFAKIHDLTNRDY
jgi:hypothetical protein